MIILVEPIHIMSEETKTFFIQIQPAQPIKTRKGWSELAFLVTVYTKEVFGIND